MTLALLILAIPAAFALGWRARGEYEAAGRMRREPDEHAEWGYDGMLHGRINRDIASYDFTQDLAARLHDDSRRYRGLDKSDEAGC